MIWEERWHPLREEWIIVAAHRQDRPWNGITVEREGADLPDYLQDCYLCPGNTRVNGKRNDLYTSTFVFDNDHPCVGLDAPEELERPCGIYRNRPARGLARVVCYSPRHNATLAELAVSEIEELLGVWQQQSIELGRVNQVRHVLIFENKGEVVGVSNPHPHCQIYATNFEFKTIETEGRVSHNHMLETGRVLFQDILEAEREEGRRVIAENGQAIAFVPFFARYAYEVYLAPKRTQPGLGDMRAEEVRDLAEVMKVTLVKMDNLWRMSFPYVMAVHQAPVGGGYEGFHFHIEIHPPLRRANLLKYLAGPEIGGGNFLSDTSPEEKAAELRAQPDLHYKLARKQ
jgi:UDPglucose--hexose-1-phosphate uridylyltransferase